MTKAQILEALFNKMQYCPVCGGKLKRFGSLATELKTCDESHGVMYMLGKRQGTKIGMFLEVYEE